MELTHLTVGDLVTLSLIAIVATTTGSLIALILKERLLTRWFQGRKIRRSLDQAYRSYRDPIVLAALELCNRLVQVCRDYPPEYLRADFVQSDPEQTAAGSPEDLDLRRYSLESSVYRLCSLLGWIELYRQDIVFLDTHNAPFSRQLDKAIYAIRADLADAGLNIAPNRDEWRDVLLFREEQRAIGESMITTVDNNRVIIGYAQFCELLAQSNAAGPGRWLKAASAFFVDPKDEKDFRLVRMQRLIVHLVDLVQVLAPGRLRDGHREARERYRSAAIASADLTSTGVAVGQRP